MSKDAEIENARNAALADIHAKLVRISTPWSRKGALRPIVSALGCAFLGILILLLPLVPHHRGHLPLPAQAVAEARGAVERHVGERVAEAQTQANAVVVSKIQRADDAVAERQALLAALTAPCPPGGCSATELIERAALRERLHLIEASLDLGARARESETGTQATKSDARARKIRFGLALAFALCLGLASTFFQLRVAARHWYGTIWLKLPEGENHDRVYAILYGTGIFAAFLALLFFVAPLAVTALFVCLIAAATLLRPPFRKSSPSLSRPLIWAPMVVACLAVSMGLATSRFFLTTLDLLPEAPFSEAALAYYGVSLLIAVTAVLIALTAFSTLETARNFPRTRGTWSFMQLIRARQEDLAAGKTFASLPSSPGDLGLWSALSAWQSTPADQIRPVPVARSLSPTAAAAVIREDSRLLTVNLIAALLVFSLGMDVLTEASKDDALSTIATQAKRNWMVWLAAGATATLALVYVWPAVSVRPYQEAEAAMPNSPAPKTRSWRPRKTYETLKAQNAPDAALALATGCTRDRLDLLYTAGSYGGGLHAIVQARGEDWIKGLTTLLAPAVATGVLGIFG